MFTISGIVVPGGRSAVQTLPTQMKLFSRLFPELQGAHTAGTLNLEFDGPLIVVANPTWRSPRLRWAGEPGEVFDFLEIMLEAPSNSNPVRAWFYIPYDSSNRVDVSTKRRINRQEVIAPFCPGVKYGTSCRVHIHRPIQALDYRHAPMIIIQ